MLERRLPQVDLFIARSAFSRDMHARFGFERPMSVLPYFLPDDSAPASPGAPQPVGTTAQRAPHPRPYFLFVGRLARIKGVHTLIPQFARYPHADLLIVGDGEDEAMLRTTAAGVPNVHFAGRAPNDQLTGYYAHALAVLCPSVGYETFGIVLIEAMRARVPVIARRIGPFPEIVESSGGGLLYDDDDQLAACLARVQQDAELRAAMADRGYRASVERWSESVVIPQLLELIDIARAARERRGGTA
jgi:glycosyltransferase involved in cell wall biosynthesis